MSALKAVRRSLKAMEGALSWLFCYPLMPVQLSLFFLVAWGRLGYSLGAEDIFWSESTQEQILNGFGCAVLFGEILLVRYLLDPGLAGFKPHAANSIKDPGLIRLAQYLLALWLPSLLVLEGGKLFSSEAYDGSICIWPLFVGMTLGVVVSVAAVCVAQASGFLEKVQKRLLPTAVSGDPLHAIALLTAILFLLSVGLVYGLRSAGHLLPPTLLLCLFLGLANSIYGAFAFWAPGSQYVAISLLLGSALYVNSGAYPYRFTFPNLEEEYGHPQSLENKVVDTPDGPKPVDQYCALLESQSKLKKGETGKPELISSEEPLKEMAKRWKATHQDKLTKPRLILVACSGGGIRAAVWTAVVLEGLERELATAPFRGHIRLFSGASGGMVAAGLYVADFDGVPAGKRAVDKETWLGGLSGELAKDSLRGTLQTMLLDDLPSLWRTGPVDVDRGRKIEVLWKENTRRENNRSPFEKTFQEIKESERAGLCPSLVFTPMLVEDARRLFISNLDLLNVTWTSGEVLGFKPFAAICPIPEAPTRPQLSISAVELFRLFAQAPAKFEVGTACRMNASFPFIGPGVSLPTVPCRRVVDAGYYDNFGVDFVAMWLARHESAIREFTSGVALIEIRAYRNGYARWHFQDKEQDKNNPDPASVEPNQPPRPRRDKDAIRASLEWLSTPAEAILNARTRAAYYRNDELIDLLNERFNTKDIPDFFTTIAFECDTDAALSWSLPRRESHLIAEAFYRDPDAAAAKDRLRPWILSRVSALSKWFGEGGR